MTNLFRNCFRCRLWTILEFIAGSKHLNKKGNAMQYFILNIWAQLNTNTNTNTNTKHPSPPISSVHVPNFWISWSYRFFALSHPADFAPWWGFSIVRKVLCLAYPWYTSSECDWTTEVSLNIWKNMRFQFWTWVHGINDSTLKGSKWLNKLAKLRRHQSVTYRYREFPVPGIPGTGNFFIFLVVSEPVSEQIGTGKKSRNRYRQN